MDKINDDGTLEKWNFKIDLPLWCKQDKTLYFMSFNNCVEAFYLLTDQGFLATVYQNNYGIIHL